MRVNVLLAIAALLPVQAISAQPRPFSSSDAADAAERLTGRRAHMGMGVRRLSGERLYGPAITMQLVRDDRASLMGEGLKAVKVFEEAPPGSVIVVCLDGDKDFAVFGATFATLAKSRRLAGVVSDGAMRGAGDLKRIGVPFYARSTVSGSAGGHYRLESINQPVVCDGAAVSPGDVVVGDDDGVAVIPKDSIRAVLAAAQRLRDEKDEILPLITKHRSYTTAANELRKKRAAAPRR